MEQIINGVDNEKCKYYEQNRCNINGDYFGCHEIKDCYYKQLRRKEEECNGLKSQLDYEIQKFDVLEEKLKNKDQALDEIEEYVNENWSCSNNQETKHILQIIQKVKGE